MQRRPAGCVPRRRTSLDPTVEAAALAIRLRAAGNSALSPTDVRVVWVRQDRSHQAAGGVGQSRVSFSSNAGRRVGAAPWIRRQRYSKLGATPLRRATAEMLAVRSISGATLLTRRPPAPSGCDDSRRHKSVPGDIPKPPSLYRLSDHNRLKYRIDEGQVNWYYKAAGGGSALDY